VATSEVDAAALEALAGLEAGNSRRVSIVPNGVDLGYFAPQQLERHPATIVMTGKMSYHANVTAASYFCSEVLPLLQSQRSDVRVVIVGKDPADGVRRLTRNPAISVTGYVPDIRPYLARATLAVSPILYGAGCQNKVLEAMAMGTPVVSTPASLRGLRVVDGKDVVVAATASAMASKILELLGDAQKRTEMSANGRLAVEKNYEWAATISKLESVYAAAITNRRAGSANE
jgi:glycosyltransferase involved in cell wall biosynthesis